MRNYSKSVGFFLEDFPRQLFPLDTSRTIIEHAHEEIGDYIRDSIFGAKGSHGFSPQQRVYADKPGAHLRRTLKLDPVAEFYFYDLMYRNRNSYRRNRRLHRRNFGYRFVRGKMLSPAKSYKCFKGIVHRNLESFRFCAKLDIAQYFNSLYHHDIVSWFEESVEKSESASLGGFLREINSGRSIDCLPQGLYPSKIVGSQFLRFVDESALLKSARLIRFMDDIYVFDNEENVVRHDFHQIQRLLGEKNLSLNSAKTLLGDVEGLDIEREVDEIKERLLEYRSDIVFGSGADEEGLDETYEQVLDEEGLEYLLDLLRNEHLEEEDAELVLSVMRDHSEDVLEHIPLLLGRFPALSKSLFYFADHVFDTAGLLHAIRDYVCNADFVSEFQLFWIAKICEEYLMEEKSVEDLLLALFKHPSATLISRAKILEIPEQRFGFPDLREIEINNGSSSWLGWSAAVGSRNVPKAKRNHILKYFAKASPVNRLVSNCVQSL